MYSQHYISLELNVALFEIWSSRYYYFIFWWPHIASKTRDRHCSRNGWFPGGRNIPSLKESSREKLKQRIESGHLCLWGNFCVIIWRQWWSHITKHYCLFGWLIQNIVLRHVCLICLQFSYNLKCVCLGRFPYPVSIDIENNICLNVSRDWLL